MLLSRSPTWLTDLAKLLPSGSKGCGPLKRHETSFYPRENHNQLILAVAECPFHPLFATCRLQNERKTTADRGYARKGDRNAPSADFGAVFCGLLGVFCGFRPPFREVRVALGRSSADIEEWGRPRFSAYAQQIEGCVPKIVLIAIKPVCNQSLGK